MATTTVTRLGGYAAVQHDADCREKLAKCKTFVAVQQILGVLPKFVRNAARSSAKGEAALDSSARTDLSR